MPLSTDRGWTGPPFMVSSIFHVRTRRCTQGIDGQEQDYRFNPTSQATSTTIRPPPRKRKYRRLDLLEFWTCSGLYSKTMMSYRMYVCLMLNVHAIEMIPTEQECIGESQDENSRRPKSHKCQLCHSPRFLVLNLSYSQQNRALGVHPRSDGGSKTR